MGGWFLPQAPLLGRAIAWLLGPTIGGRPKDLRVLRLDGDSDDAFDASDALASIRCPTLVVSGGRDLAYPSDLVRELVAALPNARHLEYPKAGHRGDPRFAEDACAFLAAEHDGG
jgi:pimeloyl-ACP methyl ester carboxylesterase